MKFALNAALRPLVSLTNDDGWETSVGQAFKTIFYTGNYFACYSPDAGASFQKVSPFQLARSVGQVFCCDQVVHYVPAANMMVWILLADAGPVLMCLARPEDIVASKGRAWTIYVLSAAVYHRPESATFDYPQVSFGDQYLYLTFNTMDTGEALVSRFEFGQLRERGTLHFQYFVATGNAYVCPCQNSGNRGLFAVQNSISRLHVYDWKETSSTIQRYDVNIATIPTEDWVSLTPPPGSVDWLSPGSKVDSSVMGAARRRADLWIAWTGARRVSGRRENSFPHPHIGIAIVNVPGFKLVEQRYVWNNNHAYAYPSLSSNPAGEIALTFMWGGGQHHVQHGVGFLTGATDLWSTTNDIAIGGGGHYITARMAFPEIDRFIGAGYNSPRDTTKPAGYRNDPRYVLFER